jgi:catechol 2,3-dioxygenase-like lactoylglutathione lyase family enzyme
MKIVPIMHCRDMAASISFYTEVLDFRIKYRGAGASNPVVTLINGIAEIELSVVDGTFGNPVNIIVDEVDNLFKKYISRGLDTSNKKGSPVHQGPLDQTWGTREFYVNDPDNNTLRFVKEPIEWADQV